MELIIKNKSAVFCKLLNSAIFFIFALIFIFSYFYTIPAEDAVILYEYSKNLAIKGVITYGASSVPIEGATDFLWMVIIAVFRYFNINEFQSALTLNFVALILIILCFKSTYQKLIVGLAILATPYLYSTLSGFSAIFFSAFYVLCLKLLLERSKYLYVFILCLCLIRPDGVVWGCGLVFLRLIQDRRIPEIKMQIFSCIKYLFLPGLVYFVWRYWYFGELLPLPFLVKSTFKRGAFFFNGLSVADVSVAVVPFIVVLIAYLTKLKELKSFLVIFFLPICFYSAMSLSQNIGNRFMAPFFFGGLFLIIRFYSNRALILYAIVSVYFQYGLTIETATTLVNSSRQNIYHISRNLSSQNGRMLITEAGRLAYYSNWFAEDSWGLNTPRYAKKLISVDDIRGGKYDLIVAHCDIPLLDYTPLDLTNDGSRGWDNQCKNIINYIVGEKFEIYLVPFESDGKSIKQHLIGAFRQTLDLPQIGPKCKRYDVYALSPNFIKLNEVTKILVGYGAVKYSKNIVEGGGDTVCTE